MVKVTGYKLREALRKAKQRAEIAHSQFEDSLWAFPDEEKNPKAKAAECEKADRDIAHIESVQQWYNQQVSVKALDETMPLSEAIKLVGSAGRMEKTCRTAATGDNKKRSWIMDNNRERDKDHEYAAPTLTPDQAAELANKAGSFAAALRSGIAMANSKELDVDIDPDLLA